MKLIFTVKSETKNTGYTTVALSVACDDPGVEVSIAKTANGEDRLFIKTSPEKAPLKLEDIRELVLVEEVPEEPTGI